jgi:spore germination cell wall hydrolase CwlJ-like protein
VWCAAAIAVLLCSGHPALAEVPIASEQEVTCLALNIYHEARNQPLEGQLAVAHVTLNRVEARDGTTVCREVYRAWAFSWTRDPRKRQPPSDRHAWWIALAVARWAIADRDSDPVHGSTYFHSVAIMPDWAPSMVRVRQIGDHVFYRDSRADRAEVPDDVAGASRNP